MRRRLALAVGMLVAIVAAAALGAYGYARRSLPQTSGTIRVDGLAGPVEIVRDADAVPHIFASVKADALFGLGFVHAQDRLWQMEFQRRIGHGTLSEVFGEATVPQDRFLRTVGFGRAARSAWDRLPGEARQQIEAYVAGVNAFLAADPPLPPEFTLLRFRPAPWTGPDVLVWVKMMAWDLSANYSHELLRHDLVAAVGADRTAQLMPPYPGDGLSIVSTPDQPRALEPSRGPAEAAAAPHQSAKTDGPARAGAPGTWSAAWRQALAGSDAVRRRILDGGLVEALGSNNWVVDGTLTATGKPLLANDPHLGTHVPSLWYLAHMSAGDFDVIGATLPGAPAVAIGRNRYIAWGETNVGADVEDLYRERLDPTGRFAEYRGALEPLQILQETIAVAGGEPVSIEVRISRHGPLVSDAINANNAAAADPKPAPLEPLAFRWTALDASDDTVVAFLQLNEARNWDEFLAAMRLFVVPAQNFVYADVEGHIGYFLPGRIPIRAAGDGSSPAEGWTGEMEWTGWIPFEDLPRLYDPPEHFIVTANHRPAGPGYPHHIALEYPDPYRAQRIVDRLSGRQRLTVEDFREIQADTLSLHAAALVPLLVGRARPVDEADRRALEVLRRWDFDASAGSAAAPIFQAWFLRLAGAIAGDELGPAILDDYRGRFSYTTRFVTAVLAAGDSPWCDDVTTGARETCEQAVTKALHEGVADLVARLGSDPDSWRWDAVHRAVFPHQGLDSIGPLRWLLSRSIPNVGDWSTVNVGTVLVDRLYTQEAVPGYRQIVDLSPAGHSRFIDAVGQSGHVLSRHYDDFMRDWRDVRDRPMRTTRADADAGAIGTLVLTPTPKN